MLCGGAMPMRKRCSTSHRDEISPKMLERIAPFSRKVKRGEYDISECKIVQDDCTAMAAYKDPDYRDRIAARYGIYTMQNDLCFLTPHLAKNWTTKGGETDAHQHNRPGEQESGDQNPECAASDENR